jgi:hypothetical protein
MRAAPDAELAAKSAAKAKKAAAKAGKKGGAMLFALMLHACC